MGFHEDDRIRHKNELSNKAIELLASYHRLYMAETDILAAIDAANLNYDLKSTILSLLRKEQAVGHNID